MHMRANMYTSTLPWIGRFEGNPRFFFTANGDPRWDAPTVSAPGVPLGVPIWGGVDFGCLARFAAIRSTPCWPLGEPGA